jgi:hypothetical protein
VSPAAKKKYERQMQALGTGLSTYLAGVGKADLTATQAQAVANIEAVQAHLRDAAAQLEAMDVPPDVRSYHQDLIKGVRDYAGELDQIIVQLKKGNREALGAISRLPGIQEMGKATLAIVTAGYNITGNTKPAA